MPKTLKKNNFQLLSLNDNIVKTELNNIYWLNKLLPMWNPTFQIFFILYFNSLYSSDSNLLFLLKILIFFPRKIKVLFLYREKIYITHVSFNTKIKDGNNQENKGLVGAALCQLVKEFHRFYFIYKIKIIYTAVDLLTQYIYSFFN